jgi:adenylate cyclase
VGAGLLVEFDPSLEATEGAIALHRTLFERNPRTDGRGVEMRVGIHLGDVTRECGDVFGDAVNLAARIEPWAAASGICIGGAVFDHARTKLPCSATPA